MKKDILNRVKKVDFTIQRNFLNTKEKNMFVSIGFRLDRIIHKCRRERDLRLKKKKD